MDFFDIGPNADPRRAGGRMPGSDFGPRDMPRWPDLVARIGAEIAGPLTAALERINGLVATGKIDTAGLRSLREEVEAARLAGMVGQQLTRFIDSRIRQSPERMSLVEVVSGVVAHRAREAAARRVTLRAADSGPVEAIVDAPLLFGLVNATVDWALANAAPTSEVRLTVEGRGHSAGPRLLCVFHRVPGASAGRTADRPEPKLNDSLTWWLLEETARTIGVLLERHDQTDRVQLSMDFSRGSATGAAHASRPPEANDGFGPSSNSQPLAGSHLLVIASRRELRVEIREALRHMSLIVDYVATVEEAAAFCKEGLPHAVIVESIQVGERFAAFRAELVREVPDLAFIEIVEEGTAFQMSGLAGTTMARVGRQALQSSLPSALMFELVPRG